MLGADELGDPSGTAWTEVGEIDRRGHDSVGRAGLDVEIEVDRIAAAFGSSRRRLAAW